MSFYNLAKEIFIQYTRKKKKKKEVFYLFKEDSEFLCFLFLSLTTVSCRQLLFLRKRRALHQDTILLENIFN